MRTKIISPKDIEQASKIIKDGGVVAFPTETVYGLGADALNSSAVKRIFVAKGRPQDNPLIVHIAEKKEVYNLAKDIPKSAKVLMDRFWPGPLTIILKKRKIVPSETTANLQTIAIRMPKNKIALNLIKSSKTPLAAPSANISSKPSSTSFEHVFNDFNKKINAIIKSSKSEIGLESTVVDLTVNPPLLLRPGGLSFEKLKKILKNLIIYNGKSKKIKSPGMKYTHYSPNAKIILFSKNSKDKIKDYKIELKNKKIKIIDPNKVRNFSKKMFDIFRQCDKDAVEFILINSVDETGINLAVMNRLRKAASIIL